ncbi:MAG: hypothetical protein RL684_2822, partial [Pseudomonadota bacterium]
GAGIGTDTRYGESHKWTNDFALNVKWLPNDRWAVSGDVQFVKSHADVLSQTAYTNNSQTGTLDFNLAGDTPYFNFQGATNPRDQSLYYWAAAMDHHEKNDAHSFAERFDAEYTFDDNPWLRSFRFGGRATQKEAITRQTGWNWGLLSSASWCGFCTASYINDGHVPDSAVTFRDFSNFFRGSVHVPGVAWFPSDGVVSNGSAYTYSVLHATELNGWGWSPLSNDYSQARPGGDNPNGGINDQHEKTQSAYFTLRFGHDTPIGPMDGNLGLRVVHTAVDTGNLVRISSFGNNPGSCTSTYALDCADWQPSFNFATANAGTYNLGTIDNSYNDYLPSLNIRFKLRDDLQLRFAVSKAMVRPTFSQMQQDITLGYSFDPTGAGLAGIVDGVNAQGTGPHYNGNSGTSGNVHLNPTRAMQYDTSLEWYFAPAGSLTLAGFYKDVKDYIFNGQLDETYTFNGQTLHFLVTRNINGDHGTIKGFELAYQQFYTQLPGALSGLGVQANFTYVDSNGGKNTAINVFDSAQLAGSADSDLPLEGMSKSSYNAALIYEKYGWSGRLAYNWRDQYLLTTSAANIARPVWSEAYGQLDGSVFYSVTDHVKVGLQGVNLLNARTFLDVGGAVLHPRYSWTDTDRRIAVAIRASF